MEERNKRALPKPGEFYRHFKDKLYQVITVANHSETGEKLVIYQALYGNFGVYARPLDMFLSEVDREKYPDTGQNYRFELVVMEERCPELSNVQEEKLRQEVSELMEKPEDTGVPYSEADGQVDSVLLAFLEAESYEEKLIILTGNRKHIGDKLLNDMAASIDCTIDEGSLEERYNGLLFCLQTFARFESSRLR